MFISGTLRLSARDVLNLIDKALSADGNGRMTAIAIRYGDDPQTFIDIDVEIAIGPSEEICANET